MRHLSRNVVVGALLGTALLFAPAAVPAASASEGCLLIICVDAPIVGPVVGGIGDGVDDVLSPDTGRPDPAPAPPPPAPQPPAPVPPAPNQPAPGQPAPGQPAPQQPNSGKPAPNQSMQGGASSTSPDSEKSNGGQTETETAPGETIPAPATRESLTPSPSSTPLETPQSSTDDGDGILPPENDVLSRLPVGSLFILGSFAALFVALFIYFLRKAIQQRRSAAS